jgi:ATP-dependent helicase HrpA
MLIDRHRLKRKLRELRDAARQGKPFDRNWQVWQTECERSRQEFASRLASRPAVTYDETLPVHARRQDIADAIAAHQVVVVCGETGSGKSTQLPKICLEIGRGVAGMIGHTQPRRIAARSIAARVAEELGVPLGREVGYQVRFADQTSSTTCIKLLTDGLLLAETQGDRWLNRYDTLIIDEAHERSLNIDLLLGYLHRLLPKRPELKVILTSATIDAQRFAQHFETVVGPVPIIEVSGRGYPVDLVYRAPELDDRGEPPDPEDQLTAALDEVCHRGPGDVLIFLPTEREIHAAMKVLRGRRFPGGDVELLPLYARLSTAEQQRVFQTGSGRRVVLATNVAESSLTVPGIRYVIDTGTVRLSRYSPKSKLQRLPIEPISQASANQRAGRCGRIGPGVCIRLYSADDFARREPFTAPEIVRANLSAVILQLAGLDLGQIEQFPFLEAPKSEAIRDGQRTLFEIHAMDEQQRLTPLGKQLHRLPVDPRIARIIVAAEHENCLDEVLIIAAALEIQDPRERPFDKQQLADEAHARFQDADSDFLSLLKVWDFYHRLKDDLTRSQLRKACQQNFLSWMRLKEWADVHRELADLVSRSAHESGRRSARSATSTKVVRDWSQPFDPARYAAIHRAILTGFFSGVAQKTETGEYLVAGGPKTSLWPGSGLTAKGPKWIVATELVETGRRYLRTAARIDPAWIEPLAPHLVNRSYSDPYWDREALAVLAQEKVSLWGLPIVPKRRVRFHRIDAAASRSLFLRQAILAGDWPDPPAFLQHNLALQQELHDLQARQRQPVPLKSDDELLEFYEARIPPEICDGRALVQWLNSKPAATLEMTREDLLEQTEDLTDASQYPSVMPLGVAELPLEYRHDPGGDADGVTVKVPQTAINQLDEHRLGWLVPGLVAEKVLALLKTLPKEVRRDLVPLPDTAREVSRQLTFGQGAFPAAVAEAVTRLRGVSVLPIQFQEDKLPDHLRLRIDVVDATGDSVAAGRDLTTLRQQVGAAAATSFAAEADSRWTRDGLTQWDFGRLPDSVPVRRGGLELQGYPALIDAGHSIELRLLDSSIRAAYERRFGLRRLYVLACSRDLKRQVDHISTLNAWTLVAQTWPQPAALYEQLVDLVADRALVTGGAWPQDQDEFTERVAAAKRLIPQAATEVIRHITPLFESYSDVRRVWARLASPAFASARQDLQWQLHGLLAPGFLVKTPFHWLIHYPRYLRGIIRRIDKLTSGGAARDAQLTAEFRGPWQRGQERLAAHAKRNWYDPELELYRWMLEEYRILLFAQDLGTAVSVSAKKLDKQWDLVQP